MAHDRKGARQRTSVPATSRVVLAVIAINVAVDIYAHDLHGWSRWLLLSGLLLISTVCVTALVTARRAARSKDGRP